MTIRILSLLFFISLSFSLFSTAAQAQDNSKAAVVRIENTKREEVGAGFVVRIVDQKIYVVTAAHVVRGDQHPKVYLFTQQDEPVLATLIDQEDDDIKGLALLRLNGTAKTLSGLAELKLRATDDLGNSESVKFIGFPASTSLWTVDSGNVKRLQGRNLVLSGFAKPGNSGGPVVLDQQAVGLITDITQSDIYAVRSEVIVPYVNGFVSNLISISGQKNPVITDEFCAVLLKQVDASKGGFYSAVGNASVQQGTFIATLLVPGAAGGYVRPGSNLYNYLSVQQDKGKADSLFYTSVSKVRTCLAGWQEKETSDVTYRYQKFRHHEGSVVVSVYYNPSPQNGNYWVLLDLSLPSKDRPGW